MAKSIFARTVFSVEQTGFYHLWQKLVNPGIKSLVTSFT